MLKIEKFILSGVLLLTQLSVWGQNNTASPYTRFGFGEIADSSFVSGLAKGGVGKGSHCGCCGCLLPSAESEHSDYRCGNVYYL